MRRTLLLLALAAALLAGATGCTDPRACQTDDDCFQGQTCTDQTCVGEISTGDSDSTGRDTDAPNPGEDTGDSPTDDTGDNPPPDTDPSPDDTGGSTDTGDTSMRPLCEASASSSYCRNNSSEECVTGGSTETDINLGCWDTDDDTMDELVERLDQRHCLCNLSRGGDLRKDEFTARIRYARHAGMDDCPWKEGTATARITFTIKGCNAEEMKGITLRESSSNPCHFTDQPGIDETIWCQRDNEAGTLTLNWKPSGDFGGGLPRIGFELYTSDRRLSFEYDVTATASVPD